MKTRRKKSLYMFMSSQERLTKRSHEEGDTVSDVPLRAASRGPRSGVRRVPGASARPRRRG
ncbi:hypothetical protein GTY82_27565 [Streptomyces sp. SID5476]|nr:hypothetical protein [Streptomyces sp. SID5476]